MRIGMMLRALDEKGGVGVYTQNLMKELLELDRRNEYVLFYRTSSNLGRFRHLPNVRERLVRAPNKACWDQIAIPLACLRDKVDVVFHPKFTVPLLAPCRAVMVVHGADWFIPEQAQFYNRRDVRYIRTFMPWYFRKASVVISVSQLTTDNFYRVLKLPPGKIETVYFGPARHFKRVRDPQVLATVREKYDLPQRFILTLTKLGDGNRKNFRGIAQAYRIYHESTPEPLPLVVAGKDCYRLRHQYRLPEDGYGRNIIFPGWIPQVDLPAIYSLADVYLYASNLEAFPIPVTEAMACGTPIITSRVNGLAEIAGDAALLVDPGNRAEIAKALNRVLAEPDLRWSLSERGLERAAQFTWDRCVRRTLEIIENLVD